MEATTVEMNGSRRLLLFAVAGLFAVFLGFALSVALAHPAGAATLAVPTPPTLPVSVPSTATLTGVVSDALGSAPALPSNPVSGTVSAVTAAASGVAPLPTGTGTPLPLPVVPVTIPGLPLPTVPLPALPTLPITKPSTGTLPTGLLASGTPATGPTPGTGGAAHGSTGRTTSSTTGHTSSTGRRGGSLQSTTPGTPAPSPAHRVPGPATPFIPSNNDASTSPGHGSSPWNTIPLTVALLALLGFGAVVMRRRLPLRLLFDSRLTPPG
jgi:MYXO-CTERM domain-containing protein